MKKILLHSEKGVGVSNEDIVGAQGNVAWVLDGATPVFSRHFFSDNDVVWLVEQLNRCLPNFIDDASPLADIMQRALQQVRLEARKIYNDLDHVKPFELPTFTVVMVRISDTKLEYFVLGDCGMLVTNGAGTKYVTDKRLAKFTKRNVKNILEAPNDEDTLETLRDTRKLLNTEHGYWIGSIDGKGIPQGITGTIDVCEKSRVLCFSDGYSRIFDLYHLTDVNGFVFESSFVRATIEQCRRIEAQDAKCKSYPRVKQSDDLSVVLLEV